jgi:hypothetical protein
VLPTHLLIGPAGLVQGWGSDDGDDAGLGEDLVKDFHFGGGLFEKKERREGNEEEEEDEEGRPAKKSKKEVGWGLSALGASFFGWQPGKVQCWVARWCTGGVAGSARRCRRDGSHTSSCLGLKSRVKPGAATGFSL